MARNMDPVLKKCRSLGIEPSVLGISKKSNRNLSKNSRKLSEYGLQLIEKQKAKFIYGVLEKQFRNYFEKASKQRGISGENLLRILELRLDNVVYRLGYARTRKEARQIVGHKLILVNGKKVNIASYRVKEGDIIEVKELSSKLKRFEDILSITSSRVVPEWLTADHDNLKGTVNYLPKREQIDVPINETLIVELYSK